MAVSIWQTLSCYPAQYPPQPERDCISLWTKSGINLIACDEQRHELEAPRDGYWLSGIDHNVCAWDQYMGELGMPGISDFVPGLEIEFMPPEEGFAGMYFYGLDRIVIFDHKDRPIHWHDSIVNHELWHMYEDKALYLTRAEWAYMSDNLEAVENPDPRHFMLGSLAYTMQREIMLDAAGPYSEPREVECEF